MDTVIEILIDNSNSMGDHKDTEGKTYLLLDGSTRMSLAKKILSEVLIPELNYVRKVALRTFHYKEYRDNRPIQNKIDQIYSGPPDKAGILKKIEEIANPERTGGTPISAALKFSIDLLKKELPSTEKKIILLTDGEETGGGDFKQAARDAISEHGISCKIFIVGICQDVTAMEKSKQLATGSGGIYVNLKDQNFNIERLKKDLRPIYLEARNDSIRLLASGNKVNKINSSVTSSFEGTQNLVNAGKNKVEEKVFENASLDNVELIKENNQALQLFAKQLASLSDQIQDFGKDDYENIHDDSVKENREQNEKVRLASEKFLYTKLLDKFGERVKWLNEEKEEFKPYDFEVTDPTYDTRDYYIECKASRRDGKMFLMTKTEWNFFLENYRKYQLFYISNALTNPVITRIENLMDSLISGKVVPYSTKNLKIKADRIVFTILEES